jgi:hypothetical protein
MLSSRAPTVIIWLSINVYYGEEKTMGSEKPDRNELTIALEKSSRQFCEMVRSLSEEEADKPVINSEWSVGQTATHVLTVVRRLTVDRRRSQSAVETALLNQQCLEEMPQQGMPEVAHQIEEGMQAALTTVYPRIPEDKMLPFHGGTKISLVGGMAVVLGEFLLHGYDIAKNTGRNWEIEPHLAYLNWRGIAEVFPAWLNAGAAADLNETYLFRFEGETTPVSLVFKDGKVEVTTEEPEDANFIIAASPVEVLLTFPYGRINANEPALDRLASFFEPI